MLSSKIPEKTVGDWKVDTFVVSDKQAKMNEHVNPRHAIPGTYKKLSYKKSIVMTNSPIEIKEASGFCNRAFGDVLINGLGIGLVIDLLLNNGNVKSITVVEKNPEVIELVYPIFSHIKRLEIIQKDAFKFVPDKFYNCVWHDIWFFLDKKNIAEMEELKDKYKHNCIYQECWGEEE